MIYSYMSNHKVLSFSSYDEALPLLEQALLLSIREPKPTSKPLIQFLQKLKPPRPYIILSHEATSASDLQFLVNHFNIYRILPLGLSNKELQEIASQAFKICGNPSHMQEYDRKNMEGYDRKNMEGDKQDKNQSTERQLLESARLAELGILASSIAHEIRNPLGALATFISLITKVDSSKQAHHKDILEIEKISRECQEVVALLLNFSRNQGRKTTTVDLREVIKESRQKIEAQEKQFHLEWSLNYPKRPLNINGSFEQLTQAFEKILQNGLSHCEELSSTNKLIQIHLQDSKEDLIVSINIFHNSSLLTGFKSDSLASSLDELPKSLVFPSELPLVIAHKIISEHEGKLDVCPQTNGSIKVNIIFKRLDLTSL